MIKNKSYNSKKRKQYLYRKWALALVIICLLIGAGYITFKQATKKSITQTTSGGATINLEPPTATDKKEAEANKDRLSETKDNPDTTTPPANTGQKKSVNPTITEASRTGVKAYISGIFEEGGTCTATFTRAGKTLTKTSTGFQNASYTQCAPINYDSSFLSSGTWSVTVTYSSGTAEGVSDASNIE